MLKYNNTHMNPITSITAILLPFVTYLLTLPRMFWLNYVSCWLKIPAGRALACVCTSVCDFSQVHGTLRPQGQWFGYSCSL
jgi:hypothetical protein